MSKYGLLAVSTVVLCCIRVYWCKSNEVENKKIRVDSLEFWKGNSLIEKAETATAKETLHNVKSRNNREKRRKSKNKKSRSFRRKVDESKKNEDDPKPEVKQSRRYHDFLRMNRPQKRYHTSLRSNTTKAISFKTLTPYNIAAQLKELEKLFPLENITQEIIGRSAEYNDIVLIKVKYNSEINRSSNIRAKDRNVFEEGDQDRKIIFVVNGLSVMGIHSLPCLTKPKELAHLLQSFFEYSHIFDIFVVPMANPDGMVSQQSKIWNKNMSPQKDCPGVALDRNFDIGWNGTKEISSCSQQYPGEFPFSEPETDAISYVFHHYGTKIVAYFHIHAGTFGADVFRGDAVLYPKGYSEVQSDDDKYIDLKGAIEEVMRNASFRFLSVAVQPLHSWYGLVSGTSVDYASTVYGIPYAMELAMQIYENSGNGETWVEKEIALIDLWKPVIDVIMGMIYVDLGVKGEV